MQQYKQKYTRLPKHRHYTTILLSVLLLSGVLSTPLTARPKLKNIILISVDTLRADHLSAYGYPLQTSPHIDQLAADGVLFSNCYSLTPLTSPSFSTVFTSLPPYKHGSKRNGLSIYKNTVTFLYSLKHYGYRTGAIISNWPLRRKLSGLHQNFDNYYQVFTNKRYYGIMNSEGQAPNVNEKALEWLEENRQKQFFLWVHFTDPHAPYIQHKDYKFDYTGIKPDTFPKGTHMKRIKRYDSEIAYTDHYIGIFIKRLKELNLYDNALIIFLSDHGESFGEHNYLKHGRKLYNATLHVPLIIKLPGNEKRGTVRNHNACLLDVAPTMFSALNMMVNRNMEGLDLFSEHINFRQRRILLETYGGTVHFRRKNAKYHLKIKPIRYASVVGNHKIIYNYKDKTYEAYNLDNDQFESNNIYISEGQRLFPLKESLAKDVSSATKYIQLLKKHRLQSNSISKQDFDALKSLGYIE